MKIHHKVSYGLAIAACFAATAALSEAAQMRPGKWQITMKSSDGSNKENASSMNMTQCMTAEDLNSQVMSSASPAAGKDGDFEMNSENDGCKFTIKRKGNVTRMDSDCDGEKNTTTITHSSDAFKVESTVDSQGSRSISVMEGKRVGDCSTT